MAFYPKVNKHGFSFCETVAATGPWHLRELTEQGQKLSGGADSQTLCGCQPAWDINCEITPISLRGWQEGDDPRDKLRPGHPCPVCKQKFLEMVEDA